MTTGKKTGQKGPLLEEVLRDYFLRAGYFVVRGVPYRIDGNDLTDIDLWLYERPTGSARRRQIVDAKAKSKPKTVERLLWTKGLAEALDVNGAYVATTDTRPIIRKIAKKINILIFDGKDLQRIRESNKVRFSGHLTDDELQKMIRATDEDRKSKDFQLNFLDVKSSLIDNFGPNTIVRALENLAYFSSQVTSAYPNSPAAKLAGRLTYFSGALVAIGLDAVGVDTAFRPLEDRREILVNSIRYGNTDTEAGLEKVRLALGLVRQYADNGSVVAQVIGERTSEKFSSIPAEIIADEIVRMGTKETLFSVARKLERACYLQICPNYDELDTPVKSFLGALLDFSGIDRKIFAMAWTRESINDPRLPPIDAGSLFSCS